MTGRTLGAAAALLALAAGPSLARAGEGAPGFGPPPSDEPRSTGREIAPIRERPDADAPVVACSFTEPVCVHAAKNVDTGAMLWTLRYAESAFSAYRALGLPRPLADGALGGGPAFDLYLLPSAAAPATIADLVPTAGSWDRASAFTVMPPPHPRAGCANPFTIAQAIAHAAALGHDAGAESGALAMESSYLASLVAPCEDVELAAIDDFQRHPERSFAAGDADRPDGALLFPWFLDDTLGRGFPGRVIASLIPLASQRTPPGSWEFKNEPDVFDALRATMKDRGSTLDNLLLDFAIARAFVGSRSDGAHLADVDRFGDMGRVRFEWSIPYSSLPRRVTSGDPIEAMGMTYVWLDLTGAPPDGEITFVADWELPSLFRWSLVKVDKDGAESGRLDLPGMFGSSHAERTVVGLGGLAGIMVVGVNAGSIDRSHPFDPDEQPLMPHGYTVALYK
jgi:hypothetical protein